MQSLETTQYWTYRFNKGRNNVNFSKHKLISILLYACLTIIVLVLSSCASRAVTEIAQVEPNSAVIVTRAELGCGEKGTLSVALQMAAVATIRQGYERFILASTNSESDVQYITMTSWHYSPYGSYPIIYTIPVGSHQAEMIVFMFNQGDVEFDDALDAVQVLGPTWREKVVDGITTC